MYTASVGSFVGWCISNILVFLFFIKRQDKPLCLKLMWIVLICISIFLLVELMQFAFPEYWKRIALDQDDSGRLNLWKVSFEAWKNSPIFGNGLDYIFLTTGKLSHSTYMQLLSETGLVGLALISCFVIRLLYKVLKADMVIFCVTLGMLVQITFLDALDNRGVWIMLCWIAIMPITNVHTKDNRVL